jgi:C4-dicarboxylate transporter
MMVITIMIIPIMIIASKELVSKHKEVIDNLNRLYAGVDVDDEDDDE